MKIIPKSLLVGLLCVGSSFAMADRVAPVEKRAPEVSSYQANLRVMPPLESALNLTPKEAFKRYALSSCLHFAFKSEELRSDAAESIGVYYRTGHVSLNKAAKIKSLVDSMLGQPLAQISSRQPIVEPRIVQCINLANGEAVENLFLAPETPSK